MQVKFSFEKMTAISDSINQTSLVQKQICFDFSTVTIMWVKFPFEKNDRISDSIIELSLVLQKQKCLF